MTDGTLTTVSGIQYLELTGLELRARLSDNTRYEIYLCPTIEPEVRRVAKNEERSMNYGLFICSELYYSKMDYSKEARMQEGKTSLLYDYCEL